MMRYVAKSLLLLALTVVICVIAYPLAVWVVAQTVFPEQANGSLLRGPDGTVVGSRLIAQPFTKDEYFWPRPSAASYDASASTSSTLAPSNYMLRNRVAAMLGPIVRYDGGANAGQLVGPDIDAWFRQDQYLGNPHIVAQWADAHGAAAQAWVKADATHAAYVDEWAKAHADAVEQWKKDNPDTADPQATDLAVIFFDSFSLEQPGKFPAVVQRQTDDGQSASAIEPVDSGSDIQATFFDMWRQEHADVALQEVPADMVTASGSGLDPDITLQNALFQLDRVSAQWAKDVGRDPTQIRTEIQRLLDQSASAPFGGLAGPKLINVLEVNLELRKRFGAPAA